MVWGRETGQVEFARRKDEGGEGKGEGDEEEETHVITWELTWEEMLRGFMFWESNSPFGLVYKILSKVYICHSEHMKKKAIYMKLVQIWVYEINNGKGKEEVTRN